MAAERSRPDLRARATGALLGLALGDALGMPTQCLPREVVRARYGEGPGGVLTGLHPGPPDNELSAGLPAGHVTDDTDQALILGRLLVAGGGVVDQRGFADELLAWQERMTAAGSLDLLGPSTLRALGQIAAGADPSTTGRWGDTNGAAMRITPVGIATPLRATSRPGTSRLADTDTEPEPEPEPEPGAEPTSAAEPEDVGLAQLVAAVHSAGRVTHDTGIAVAGAAAIAAAVSAALDGADLAQATTVAVAAARLGGRIGHVVPGADVATRLEWALEVTRGLDLGRGLERIDSLIGTGVATQEAVPAAFAVLALVPDDAWLAVRAAASLGGDCDTVAAMVGAVTGALHGAEAFPARAVATLEDANPELAGGALAALADDLLALRAR